MKTHRLATAELVRLFDSGSLSGLSEWELLEQFLARRDELAFQVLVSRHGPMVQGICRRMLANAADAEDAFQATFLVLLKRADSLGPGDAIAAWLHGVAVRVAQQARCAAARRGRRERLGVAVEAAASDPSGEDPELHKILDEEINRLPLKYRAPIVLCYLEGRTHEEAARQLQWPLGTVKGRLARARSLLEFGSPARRSLRHRIVGPGHLHRHRRRSSRVTSHCHLQCGGPDRIRHVDDSRRFHLHHSAHPGGSLGHVSRKSQIDCRGLRSLGPVSDGGRSARPDRTLAIRYAACRTRRVPGEARRRQSRGRAFSCSSEDRDPWDSGPKRPPSRIGSGSAGRTSPPRKITFYFLRVRGSLDRVHSKSRLLMEAERDAATSPTARFDAVEGHFQRMRELARAEKEQGKSGDAGAAEAQAFVIQAELEVAKANAWQPSSRSASGPSASTSKGDGPGRDSKSLAILAKLDEPISMSFANETPLEDLLKYIKQATTGPNFSGIPIYVDPLGLQEAEKTLASTVQLDLEGIPLRRSLQLALSQLRLGYYVDDGILVITSQESGEQAGLSPSQIGPSPYMKKQDRAERGEMSTEELKQFAEELRVRAEVMKQLRELNKLDEGTAGGMAGGHALDTDHLTALLKEMKELVNQLKTERETARK